MSSAASVQQDPTIIEFDVRTDEMLVNMGPQHPSTHGVLRLVLRTDGEVISEVTPHLGYLHRCAEKIGENVAPIRKIEGPATRLKKPVGLFVDSKNDEVWATSPEQHAVTIYRRTAQGNAAPLRILRGAPDDTPAPGIGNPGGIAYDSTREQILVPN